MVPEYALHGQLSVKAGILLLEHATGRKNTYYKLSPEIKTLLEWASRLYKRGDNHRKHLYAFMSAVTLMLSTHSEILLDPTKPACASGRSHICFGTLTR